MGKLVAEAAGVVTGPFVTPSAAPGETAWAWEAVVGDVLTSAALARKSNPPLSMLFGPLLLVVPVVGLGISYNVGIRCFHELNLWPGVVRGGGSAGSVLLGRLVKLSLLCSTGARTDLC